MNTRRTQPYRRGPRQPGLTLQSMLAGKALGAPGYPVDPANRLRQMIAQRTATADVRGLPGLGGPQLGGRPSWEGVPTHPGVPPTGMQRRPDLRRLMAALMRLPS